MNKRPRIGIYGGSFNPVHNAHLAIARAAADYAALDRVLLVVAPAPPHKEGELEAAPEDRYAMAAAAVADDPRLEASDIEFGRDGPSYSADTIRHIQELHPDAELFFILGSDSLIDFPRWHRPGEIIDRAHLLVAKRPDANEKLPEELEGRYSLVPWDAQGTSATQLRHRLCKNEDVSGAIPPAALRVIEERGLYQCRS